MRLKAQLGVLLCGLAGFVVLGVVPVLVAGMFVDAVHDRIFLSVVLMVVMGMCMSASYDSVAKVEKERGKKDVE